MLSPCVWFLFFRVEDAFGISTRLPSLPVASFPGLFSSSSISSSTSLVPRPVSPVSSSSSSLTGALSGTTTAATTAAAGGGRSGGGIAASSSSSLNAVVSNALYAGARALQVDLRLQREQLAHQRKQQIQMVGPGGRFSFVFADGDTPVTCFSWTAAVHAAGSVISAVDAVCEGRCRNAFCAVRPPGHHLGNWGAAQTSPSTKLTDEDMA